MVNACVVLVVMTVMEKGCQIPVKVLYRKLFQFSYCT